MGEKGACCLGSDTPLSPGGYGGATLGKTRRVLAAMLLSTALCSPALAQTQFSSSQTISSDQTYANGIRVADDGTADVTIASGVRVLSAQNAGTWDLIGGNAGATGVLTVDGGSWFSGVTPEGAAVGGNLAVGVSGNGTLNIRNGGSVAVSFINIAQGRGSTGAVLIDGTGSILRADYSSSDGITVGTAGAGTLTLTNGGQAVSNAGTIGFSSSGSGTVTVDGRGSKWTVNNQLFVGVDGSGTLNITNGGTVTSTGGRIAAPITAASARLVSSTAGGTGDVTVSGAGSVWDAGTANDINMGSESNGAMTGTGNIVVSDGGMVVAGRIYTACATCTITIGALAGNTAAATGTLSVSSISLGGASDRVVFNHTGTDGSYVFSPVIAGVGGVASYNGVTVLAGSNTYTGGTAINGGTIRVSADNNLGAVSGALSFDGGTLATTQSFSMNRATTLSGGGGTFSVASGTALIASGPIGGAGALSKTDGGTLVLSGANTYAGGTAIDGGTIRVSADNNLGAATGAVSFNGGTLAATQSFGTARTMTLNSGGGTIDVTLDATLSASGPLGGAGALTKSGAGTLVLTGTNTYAGGTAIRGGTLQLGDGGTSGSIAGDVANSGNLAFNRSDIATFGGVVSGSGTLSQNGAGTTVLTGNSTYTGGTTISSGTLQLGNGGASGLIAGDVANNGLLAFNRSDTATFGGAISGTGAVSQIGRGTTVLTGNSTYTGGTTISSGTLQLGNGGGSGSIDGDVTNNATLAFDRSDRYAFDGAISGTGAVRQAGSGTTVLTAANSYRGGTEITGGTLQVAADNNLGADSGSLSFSNGAMLATTGTFTTARSATLGAGGGAFGVATGTEFTMGGVIGGSGGLVKSDGGNLVLTADNTYGGGTKIDGGTLQLGDGGRTGSIRGDVADNGNLVFNRSDTYTFGGVISGTGVVTQNGSGTTILTGDNTYTGATTVNSGMLQLGNGTTNGVIASDVVNNAVLAFNPASSTSITLPGAISGSGSVSQNGSGTTILTGNSTYKGDTTINAGTLQLGDGGASGALASDRVINNGRLAFDRSDVSTFGSRISGQGEVDQIGSGTMVLTAQGSNYSGATNIRAGTLRAGGQNVFSRNSSVTVSSGASLDLAGFNQTLPGLTNAGLVDLGIGSGPALSLTDAGAGGPGNVLTVRGNYVGQGGTLRLNTYLGADNSVSDRLAIYGGTATGSTLIDIRNAGGPGGQTIGDGIMVVQALNGATTNTGVNDHTTFQLAHRVAAGAYEYYLAANGRTNPGDQNWYLRSYTIAAQDTPPAAQTVVPPMPGGGAPPANSIPVVREPRPEVPTNAAILPVATQFGYAMLGSLADRNGGLDGVWGSGSGGQNGTPGVVYEQRSAWCGPSQKPGKASQQDDDLTCVVRVPVNENTAETRWARSGWAYAIGARGRHNQDDYFRNGPDYNYTFSGLKAGLDVFAHEQTDGTLDKAGIYVGSGQISSDVFGPKEAHYGRQAGTLDMSVYTVGGYWTHAASQGWYTDAVVQGSWYTNTRAKSVLSETISPDGFGVIGSLEGGYRFKLGSGWTLTPQAQIAYESVAFDEASDSYGTFNLKDGNSLRGRLGAHLAKSWNVANEDRPRLVSAWLRANVWHEFLGNSKTTVVGFNGENPLLTPSLLKGTWGEIGTGLGAQLSDNISLYAVGDYQHSLDGKGMQGWDGKAGMNVKW